MWLARVLWIALGLVLVPQASARSEEKSNETRSRSARVLVFLDGSRMEVESLRVDAGVVVFTTTDGNLRSVLASLVDLDATERANRSSDSTRPGGSTHTSPPPAPIQPDRGEILAGTSSGEESEEGENGRSSLPSWDGPPAPEPPEVVNRDTQGRVTMRAVRIEEPLSLDGKLDDAVYRSVPGVRGFIQQEPVEGEPATEDTEVWVLFDGENVYIAARCWDSHPERMTANEMRRDGFGIFQNDNLAVVLDTFYDRRNAFFFYTNPVGGLFDGLVTDEQDVNRDWNTVWDLKTGRFEGGWTVEMAIPFKSLRYRAAGPQVWGINFRRIVWSKNEFSYLTRIPASYGRRGMTKISSAASLVGLETPPSSKNLEVKPYLASGITTDKTADPPTSGDLDADAGFDVKYGLTRGLVFDFTYNTDFAQVEVDEQQVNLTRFSLFLPEKRDFFLEGRGIFQFGGTGSLRPQGMELPSNTPVVFYTRRIGLEEVDDENHVIPIRAGGRLTGRAGPYSIGALGIAAEEYDPAGVPATNFSVLRVKRDILRRSAVGVIGTFRSPSLGGQGTNTVIGVDSTLAFYENLRINGYVAKSNTPGRAGGDASYMGQLDYQADLFGLKLERLVAQPDFNPEMGFLRREDFQRNFAEVRVSRRPKASELFRKLSLTGGFDYTTDNRGTLETREGKLTFQMDFNAGDEVRLEYTDSYEFLPEPFEVSDEVVLPSEVYRFRNLRVDWQLAPQRKFSGSASLQAGGFYSGVLTELSYRGRVEVTPRLSVEPRIALNWVDLREGEFTTRLLGGRVNYTFSPRTALSALVQYSSVDDSLSSNVRFRWEYQPGSDLYVVYSDAYDTFAPGLPTLQNRSLVFKLTRLFRF